MQVQALSEMNINANSPLIKIRKLLLIGVTCWITHLLILCMFVLSFSRLISPWKPYFIYIRNLVFASDTISGPVVVCCTHPKLIIGIRRLFKQNVHFEAPVQADQTEWREAESSIYWVCPCFSWELCADCTCMASWHFEANFDLNSMLVIQLHWAVCLLQRRARKALLTIRTTKKVLLYIPQSVNQRVQNYLGMVDLTLSCSSKWCCRSASKGWGQASWWIHESYNTGTTPPPSRDLS